MHAQKYLAPKSQNLTQQVLMRKALVFCQKLIYFAMQKWSILRTVYWFEDYSDELYFKNLFWDI